MSFARRNSKLTINPKGVAGRDKTQYHNICPSILLYIFHLCKEDYNIINEVCEAMSEGAEKYGAFNYREVPINYSDYYNAIIRHYLSLLSGDFIDPDSGIHHASKIIAGVAVIIDATKSKSFIDDRPNNTIFDFETFNSIVDDVGFIDFLLKWFGSKHNLDLEISSETLLMRAIDLRRSYD